MRINPIAQKHCIQSVNFKNKEDIKKLPISERFLRELELMKKENIPFHDFDSWDLPAGNYDKYRAWIGDIEEDDPRLPRIRELLSSYCPEDEMAQDLLDNLCVPQEVIEVIEDKPGSIGAFFTKLAAFRYYD